MKEIRLVNKDTNLANIRKMNWDVIIKKTPYAVYHIEGHYHTIGGPYHDSCYYCCPRNSVPTFRNLIPFNGMRVSWNIKTLSCNYIKQKYEDSVEPCIWIDIERNDVSFFSFPVHNLYYGMSKAQVLLEEFRDFGPVQLEAIDFEKQFIGMKVYWKDTPGIITQYIGDGQACVIIDLIGKESEPNDEDRTVKVEFFSPHISWYRED